MMNAKQLTSFKWVIITNERNAQYLESFWFLVRQMFYCDKQSDVWCVTFVRPMHVHFVQYACHGVDVCKSATYIYTHSSICGKMKNLAILLEKYFKFSNENRRRWLINCDYLTCLANCTLWLASSNENGNESESSAKNISNVCMYTKFKFV